ncbi:hypothetical protein EDC94DRAFT_151852 [Helicostylum pulchrum]|nr:hypothetical protein EDC94DRAFT_151852 [Helicostylum pulchrum]
MERNRGRVGSKAQTIVTDLIARVYSTCRELLSDLKKHFWNVYKAIVRTIEYQKRGLPHVQVLLFLDNVNDRFDISEKSTSFFQLKYLTSVAIRNCTTLLPEV